MDDCYVHYNENVILVVVAQWENECTPLSACPLCGPCHDSSVGKLMYPIICPLRGPCRDSSVENECISLPVLCMACGMIAPWQNECISLPVLFMARVMRAQ